MSYQEDVEAAAAALVRGDEANWELARLTHKNTKRRGGGNGTKSHEDWSADIRRLSGRDFSERTSKRYASMWERFGSSNTGTLPGWAESLYKLEPSLGRDARDGRTARKHLEEASPAEAAETIKKALERPEVARQVVADQKANLTLAKARQEHDIESRAIHEARDPELRDARQTSEAAAFNHEIARIRNLLFSSMDMQASEETVELVRELVAAAQGFLDAQDFDAQLAHMIEGEN